MFESYHQEIATKFLSALGSSDVLFRRWAMTPKDDAAAIATLVQEALHLHAAPSVTDLEAMAEYTELVLQHDRRPMQHGEMPAGIGNFYAQHGETPAAVGNFYAHHGEMPSGTGMFFALHHGEMPSSTGNFFGLQHGETEAVS